MLEAKSSVTPEHPSGHARLTPNKAAFIMEPSGLTVTYAELEARSNRAAHFFRRQGLNAGDGVVFILANTAYVFEVFFGAQRAGLKFTFASSKLLPAEIEYILRDCGANILVTDSAITTVDALPALLPEIRMFNIGGDRLGFLRFEDAISDLPATPIADQSAGIDVLYSSGTTGRPKGIRRPYSAGQPFDATDPALRTVRDVYGLKDDVVYLTPAPLYHAAPLHWTTAIMRLGGTAIVMERYDAEMTLALIQKHHVSAVQFVPTHFIRMLKLPEQVRTRYDLSSLRMVVHAAAPCPIPTKEAMIRWFGPIIHEYYAGTEANGATKITSQEWLKKKGSVGKAYFGEIKICDDQGEPLPAGEVGVIYFAGGVKINYHNDPEKTQSAYNQYGWSTMGDVGRLDEDGYLFLTDRKSFMIISGGVNIYPQEIENILIQHPKVADVAVIGAPDDEMGEKVVAVVQAAAGVPADRGLADELMAFARQQLSHVKTPRQIDFLAELPRLDNGKLYKRLLRDKYWAGRTLVS